MGGKREDEKNGRMGSDYLPRPAPKQFSIDVLQAGREALNGAHVECFEHLGAGTWPGGAGNTVAVVTLL